MFKILVADDEEGQRRAHAFALEEAARQLNDTVQVIEAETSIQTKNFLVKEKYDLIILDNDFKDEHIPGHLPGIALLQIVRKEGLNSKTPVFFCTADTYDSLKPMAERYNSFHLAKVNYDIDNVATLYATQLRKGKI